MHQTIGDQPTGTKEDRQWKELRQRSKIQEVPPQPAAAAQPARVGACEDLGPHMFDFGSQDSADLLTTSWDALKIQLGTKYNKDIKM
jgi:hypothetical protein